MSAASNHRTAYYLFQITFVRCDLPCKARFTANRCVEFIASNVSFAHKQLDTEHRKEKQASVDLEDGEISVPT